jgi:hypothetical protein
MLADEQVRKLDISAKTGRPQRFGGPRPAVIGLGFLAMSEVGERMTH